MIEENEKSVTITKPLALEDIIMLTRILRSTNIPLCGDCNECMKNVDIAFRCRVYEIFEKIYSDLECKEVLKIINKHCPNLSVCPLCHVDDFGHSMNCLYIKI